METSKLLQKPKDRKLLLFFNTKSTRAVLSGRYQKISSQILFTSSFVKSTTLVYSLSLSFFLEKGAFAENLCTFSIIGFKIKQRSF